MATILFKPQRITWHRAALGLGYCGGVRGTSLSVGGKELINMFSPLHVDARHQPFWARHSVCGTSLFRSWNVFGECSTFRECAGRWPLFLSKVEVHVLLDLIGSGSVGGRSQKTHHGLSTGHPNTSRTSAGTSNAIACSAPHSSFYFSSQKWIESKRDKHLYDM